MTREVNSLQNVKQFVEINAGNNYGNILKEYVIPTVLSTYY